MNKTKQKTPPLFRYEYTRCPTCLAKDIRKIEVDDPKLRGWYYLGQKLCAEYWCAKAVKGK